MDGGYKHFSHDHNLIMHQIHESANMSCSGCKFSVMGTILVCWQCNFTLHEQCFRATRSLKHPSHPSHPLTLVPYPTYPYNSFYCNSCKITGTGLSYSCSDCEFDLHVHCARSVSGDANSHQASIITPVNYYALPNQIHGQEMVSQGGWNSHLAPNVYVPTSSQNQNTSVQHSYMHAQHVGSMVVPNVAPVSIPVPTPIPIQNISHSHAQHTYLHGQNISMVVPNVAPVSIPVPNPIPIQIPIPVHAQYQTTITQDSYMAQNPISSAPNAYISQNSSIPQNIALVFVPLSAPNKHSESTHHGDESNKPRNEGIKHYSHPHGLVLVTLKNGKKITTCSSCQETLIGKSYSCVEESCNFHLHKSCFNLDKEIRHKSHPDHPLTLLSSSPYKNENGTFTCNACFKDGTGFTYHCSICEHDLHVKCANLKETVKRDDHEHMLKLLYKCPLKGEDYTFYCHVCDRVVPKDHWTYYCKVCDYGTHLDCVDGEVCDEISEDPVVDVRSDLMTLEEAIEITTIDAISRANMLNNV